jgi:molybdopterin converting factor small subunit
MKIEIEFIGFPLIFDIFQGEGHTYIFRGSTLLELVEDLVERFGDRVRESMHDQRTEAFDRAIQIIINQKEYISGGLNQRTIEEGDKVTFLRLLAGG